MTKIQCLSRTTGSTLLWLAFLLATCRLTQGATNEGHYGAFGRVSRPLAANELKDTRSPVEDQLRKEILENFPEHDRRLGKLRDVLNAPWDESGINTLGTILLSDTGVSDEHSIGVFQWESIVNMLSHLTTAKDEAVSRHAKKVFEEVLPHAWMLQGKGPKDPRWGSTLHAIALHGTAELLTQPFWDVILQENFPYFVLEAVGDSEVLKRLKDIRDNTQWPKNSRLKGYMNETIRILEIQLVYPELKRLNDRNLRVHLGRQLQGMKDKKKKPTEKFAQQCDSEDVRQVIESIAARLPSQ